MAVDYVALVSMLDRPGQGCSEPGRCGRGLGNATQMVRQAAASDQLQGKEGPALMATDLVNVDNIGVFQLGDGFGLGAEACHLLGPGVLPPTDHLERDQTVEDGLSGLVHYPHAPPPQ